MADVRRERIGVLGGTFDPPHNGHLVAAVNVMHELDLDRVLLVVAHVPWQKVGTRDISSSADRLAMVAAAATHPGLEVSDIEIEHGGDSFTADTLVTLSEQHPDSELFLIVGSDVAARLDTWSRPDLVQQLATTVVYPRAPVGYLRPPEGWDHVVVDVPALEVSSTDLRERVRDGRPVEYLVSREVAAYIAEHLLYS
jgi:nicotinate-nucleotide adenylyltransferase